MISIVVIIVLLVSACYFWKSRRQIILEGIIIGIVLGVCISYLTDANFQANVNGPFFKLAHDFNKSVKYINIAWTNISAEKVKGDKYNIRATNTNSGNTVEFNNVHVSTLPASLRYQIITWDNKNNGVSKKL